MVQLLTKPVVRQLQNLRSAPYFMGSGKNIAHDPLTSGQGENWVSIGMQLITLDEVISEDTIYQRSRQSYGILNEGSLAHH